MVGKYESFKEDFIKYCRTKQPVVSQYQYIDDFVLDSMAYYHALCKVAKIFPKWWQNREHRLIYVSQAEAYGLPYKSKDFQKEIEKERENEAS